MDDKLVFKSMSANSLVLCVSYACLCRCVRVSLVLVYFENVSHILGGKSCDDYAHRVRVWYIVDTK